MEYAAGGEEHYGSESAVSFQISLGPWANLYMTGLLRLAV